MKTRKKKNPKDKIRKPQNLGMDMSKPGALDRWKQIFAWIDADLAPDNPEFGIEKYFYADPHFAPRLKRELVEASFIRRLLSAKTAETIGMVCCPKFRIKGLASPEVDERCGAVGLNEAFRRLAVSFRLTNSEAYEAKHWADMWHEQGNRSGAGKSEVFVCAEKYLIILQAVETVKRIADLTDRKALVENAVERALSKSETSDRSIPASSDFPCKVCGWKHDGGDMTCYSDGERKYVFKGSTKGFQLLEFVHAGMAKGSTSVDCSNFPNDENPHIGDLRTILKSTRQPHAHRDLLTCVGNRRARIRKPTETRDMDSPKPSKRSARQKSGK